MPIIRALPLAAAALLALVAAAPALAQSPRYSATITRTAQGVPHVRAANMASLGYGSGYTAAEDNGCVIAETIVTVPLTRGSTMKLLPVISATALTTASMSALVKFSVTASSWATAGRPSSAAARARTASRRRGRRAVEGA